MSEGRGPGRPGLRVLRACRRSAASQRQAGLFLRALLLVRSAAVKGWRRGRGAWGGGSGAAGACHRGWLRAAVK